MSTAAGPGVKELVPDQVWTRLREDRHAVLVDVRTKPEWDFVGIPDLSALEHSLHCIEWSGYPEMSKNPRFVERVTEEVVSTQTTSIFFICRSGARSMKAAQAVSEALSLQGLDVDCVNVAEGFEGDLDPEKHRGGLNGWKARGLPWRQS